MPLDMNSVELARHNLSELLPDMNNLFEPLAPAAAAVALKKRKRRRRRSQEQRPKL